MDNLQRVMDAIARVIDKPHNVFNALRDLHEVLGEHAHKALLEYDDARQHEMEYIELESENFNLRRKLKEMSKVIA